MICSLVIKKESLPYFTKFLSSFLAPNFLSRRHGGPPSPEWAWFLHSHSFRLMTFFSIFCPRMLKITCFLASLGRDSLWFNQIHNEYSQLLGESNLNCRDGWGQNPWGGEEPLASHLEPGEVLPNNAHQPAWPFSVMESPESAWYCSVSCTMWSLLSHLL